MTGARLFLARLSWAAVFWLAAGAALSACPICFQIDNGPVVDGVRAAVIVLVAVTASVLVGFARFAVRIAGRQKDE